jgi:ligand-binding sensor domain-containing protein/serine phosphatase RsbU (regulator of sigma subunit)
LVRTDLGAATLAALLGFAPQAFAQVALPPSTSSSAGNGLHPHLRFDHITGMAKGAITTIVQDSRGFLWFGTEEGLSRYDGYGFVSYVAGAADDKTLANSTVTSLAPGKDVLWIGTIKGLDKLDFASGKFTHLHPNPQDAKSIASDEIVALFMAANGVLWLGTANAGVDSLNPETGEVHHYRAKRGRADTLTDDAITVITQDKDHRIWIGTNKGVNRLDPETGKVTRYAHDGDRSSSLVDDRVNALYQDSAGTIWIGTAAGLDGLDPKTGDTHHYLHSASADQPNEVTAIVEGADGGLWLGVKEIGVLRLDRTSGALETYRHDGDDATTIAHSWARCVLSDRGGVLWFGFNANGASKLYLMRRAFAYYKTTPGMSFFEDGDHVWLGTQGQGKDQGLRLLDLKTGAVRTYLADELSTTWTQKIVRTDDGTLWLGTLDQGLIHFTPRTGEIFRYDTQTGRLAGSDTVLALQPDGNTLWVGTFGGGLAQLDTAKNTLTFYKSQPNLQNTLTSDFIDVVYQDPVAANTLWIGTSNGLNAFDKQTGKVVRYIHDPKKPTSISHDHVVDIHRDRSGRLWITTWGGGLDLFDTKAGTFTALHVSDGLSSETLYGILEDKNGTLWITSNNGLTAFDPATHKAATYRASDGLQDDEFAQLGFHVGKSGRFYIGGPAGFNVFTPEKIQADTYVPPVALTRYEVVGEARAIPDKVSLTYRDRWFSVEYAALGYADSTSNRYKYRLVGYHDWIETDRRFVNYSSLPPGSYTLELVAANPHGTWGDTVLSLPIHVPPPPWRTWWAFTLYVLLVLLIAGLFYRRHRSQLDALRRTHRLSELEREVALSSAVQEGFFPPTRSVQDGTFRLEAFYRAAAQCGGDWWSYEARDNSYFVVVGDATGHGIGSAMVTAAAASTFRSLGPGVDDRARLQAMNDEVLRVSRGQYHMTLTAVEINLFTGQYVVRSAGGVPVFALAPGARARVLMCPGTPLGSQEFEIGVLEGQLAPGERLMILTDGVPEVALANEQILGPRGVANFYMQTREYELDSALADLIRRVEEVNSSMQDDDWTVVMVQWGNALSLDRSDPTTMVGSRVQTRIS